MDPRALNDVAARLSLFWSQTPDGSSRRFNYSFLLGFLGSLPARKRARLLSFGQRITISAVTLFSNLRRCRLIPCRVNFLVLCDAKVAKVEAK